MRARLIVTLVGAFAALSMAQPCLGRPPFENQWGPFTGTVVDAGTGQPIPGAVFTVIWIREIPHIAHASEKFFDARVAVADEQGRFEIPPRNRPILLWSSIKPPRLSCIAPEYAPFRDVGAQSAPVSVKLRRLSADEIRHALFVDVLLDNIPRDKAPELEKTINQKRKQMGLRPIHYLYPQGGYRDD